MLDSRKLWTITEYKKIRLSREGTFGINNEDQIHEDTLVDRKNPLLRKGFEEMGPTGLEPVTNRL